MDDERDSKPGEPGDAGQPDETQGDQGAGTPESEPSPATWAGRQRSSSEDAGEHPQLDPDEPEAEAPADDEAAAEEDEPEAEGEAGETAGHETTSEDDGARRRSLRCAGEPAGQIPPCLPHARGTGPGTLPANPSPFNAPRLQGAARGPPSAAPQAGRAPSATASAAATKVVRRVSIGTPRQ